MADPGKDPEFLRSLLSDLPGVDPTDPSLVQFLSAASNQDTSPRPKKQQKTKESPPEPDCMGA